MTTTQRKRMQDIRRFNLQYGGRSDGSITDYLTVYNDFCRNDGDYTASKATNLYRNHGGEYCTLLEVLNWYYSDHRQITERVQSRIRSTFSADLANVKIN